MADGKWIDDLQPTMSIVEAARHVLDVRLKVVRDLLPFAVHEAERDPEHVHRLRVATRRADAALGIFRCTIPDETYKKARRSLRSVRRAAGAARDWDVFFLDIVTRRAERPAAEHAGLDFLVGYTLGQRSAAQTELQAVEREKSSRFDVFPKSVVGSIRSQGHEGTLPQLARPLLSSHLHRLEEAADADLADFSHLHQVRIAGKRLRYAMEVFGTGFPPEFRESAYPQVEEMQDVLGRANDSHVAVDLLTDLRSRIQTTADTEWKRMRSGVDSVLRFHKARLSRERRNFLTWWKRWTKAGRNQLVEMLHGTSGADKESR
jgi:CHAD domain-containing protein